MRQRGLTIIEILILITMVGIAAAIILPVLGGDRGGNGSVILGPNGRTESRCIDGYKFVLDSNGNARQILDEFGKGVRCDNTTWK